jgi:FtsP/CotA-like multicopper oxidase with cupredoxin domain
VLRRAGGPVGRTRTLLALAAALVVLAPLGWFWRASLLPDTYSVLDMGQVDEGRPGPTPAHQHHGAPAVGVDRLVADSGPADVAVTLVARAARLPFGSGFDGYTLNGSSPGPVLRAEVGQLVEVRLVNESVPAGITLHWHGVDVPNSADGVAGVTQDAVPVGGEYTYRFRAPQAGTFWSTRTRWRTSRWPAACSARS